MKQKNALADDNPEGYGDRYKFTAIDPEIKLMPCWLVDTFTVKYAKVFMKDLAGRLVSRMQLTTGDVKVHPDAVEAAFHDVADYGMLNRATPMNTV